MNLKNNSRRLNFEIIRIIAMLLIVGHHAILYSNSLITGGITYYILKFLKCGGKFAVILFLLITGYFESQNEFSIKKVFNIIIHTIFYSWFCLITFSIFTNVDKKEVFSAIFPISYNQYWFIGAYIIIYLLIPYINKLLSILKKEELKKLLIILTFFISFIPMFTRANFQIGNVGILIYVYLIGAYIRKYDLLKKIGKFNSLLISISLYFISFILDILSFKYIDNYTGIYISLNSIFMLLSAIFLFKYFSNLKINKFNKLILFFSKTTLGVYLIHENIFMRHFIWKDVLNILSNYIGIEYYLLLILFYIILIYLICSVIDYLYLKFIAKCLDILLSKLNFFLKKLNFK